MKEKLTFKELMAVREARAFLIISVLFAAADGWFHATYVLFLLANGLNLFQANLLNVAFQGLSFALDPSTGKLADRIGQKKVYLGGLVFWGAGMLVYGIGRVFGVFLLAEAISAVGHALISQALESWLENTTTPEISHQTRTLTGAAGRIALIPSAVMGGIIGAKYGLHWPWLLSGFGVLAVAVLTWLILRRLPEGRDPQVDGDEALPVKEVVKLSWENPVLRLSAIVALVVGATTQPFNMFWSPVLRETSGQSWWLGMMWIGFSVSIAAGQLWAKNQKNNIDKTVLFIGLPMLIPFIWPTTFVMVMALIAHEFGRGALDPILFTFSQRHIEDHYRSTANSVRSAAATLGGAFGLLISGLLTFIISPVQVWAISALALIILAYWVRRKK